MITLKKGRNFVGHTARVTDFCFTIDNKFLLSTSMDKRIKIWDIIYGSVVCAIQLKQPIVSMDIDPTGEFLATVFLNSREICLWNNNIGRVAIGDEKEIDMKFMSEIKHTTSNNERSKYFSLVKVEGQQDDSFKLNQEEYNDLKTFFSNALHQNEKKRELKERLRMIQLEEHDIGKWLPLIHFDEIKEKNKPKETVNQNVTAPFFLDFHPERQALFASQIEGDIDEDGEEQKDKKPEKASKIIKKHKRNELLDQVGSPIEKIIAKIKTGEEASFLKELYEQMKQLTPAQLDYEIRKITFGNIPNAKILLYSHANFSLGEEVPLALLLLIQERPERL
jgi:U3 small nucleolar RNA-associated protein 21